MSITVSGAQQIIVVDPAAVDTAITIDAADEPQVIVEAVAQTKTVQMAATNVVVVSESLAGATIVSQAATLPVHVISSSVQGPPGIAEEEVPYAKRVDFVGETDAYIGEAVPGTTEATAAWRIKKLTFVGDDVETRWAAGASAFVHAWADRLSLTYT